MNKPNQRISSIIEKNSERTLDLLTRTVAVRSITGDTSELQHILIAELEALGYSVSSVKASSESVRDVAEFSPPDQPSAGGGIVATRSGTNGVLLFAHTDTCDPNDQPSWKNDPFTLVMENGRATGLGAADCKGGVVAIIAALRAIAESETILRRNPVVVLAEAKTGGFSGMYQSVREAGPTDGALYCHPGEVGDGMERIKVATRGILSFKLSVKGRTPVPLEGSPVSADPREGENALIHATSLVGAIQSWSAGMPDLICSINKIEAGRNAIEVPDLCTIEGTCWYSTGSFEQVRAGIQSAIDDAVRNNGWLSANRPTVDLIGVRSNPASCEGSVFANVVGDAVKSVTGQRPLDYGWHSASDIRFPMRLFNTPTVGIGSIAGNFGTADEWVDVDDFFRMVEVIAQTVIGWDSVADEARL